MNPTRISLVLDNRLCPVMVISSVKAINPKHIMQRKWLLPIATKLHSAYLILDLCGMPMETEMTVVHVQHNYNLP